MKIDPQRTDAWGIPVLRILCTHSDKERALYQDALEMMKELMHAVLERVRNQCLSLEGLKNSCRCGGLVTKG